MRRKLTCSRCPKWKSGISTCLVRGVVMLGEHPACGWGQRFIRNEYMRVYMATRRKEQDK